MINFNKNIDALLSVPSQRSIGAKVWRECADQGSIDVVLLIVEHRVLTVSRIAELLKYSVT